MAKWLTLENLAYFWSGVKAKLNLKVDKVDGKGLSTNDLTAALKSNYDSAYTHSTGAHAPSGAQANVIETIKRNGTALTPASKAVDITVPTKVSELTNDSAFITKAVTDLANYLTKTEVNSLISGISTLTMSVVTALPTSNISTTTIYLLKKATTETDNIYDEYIYVNSKWELIGNTAIDLSNYVNTITVTGSGNAITGISKSGSTLTITKGSTFSLSTHSHDTVYVKQADAADITTAEIDTILAG